MKTRFPYLLMLAFTLLVSACQSKPSLNRDKAAVNDSSMYKGTVNAPEFPKGLTWINTSHPLTLKELRGKVVLLDFWTYGCINCYHVFPDLKKLEEDFPNTLVIIGVHSAKFQSSKLTNNIRQAVLRFGLTHPVVNDRDFKIWNSYAIRAWPSFALIAPNGKIVGEMSGEGIYDTMHKYISGIIKVFGEEGKLNRKPLHFETEADKTAQSVLYFPGKIYADPISHHLFIADTDHHRIVVTSLDGAVQYVIGDGIAGFKNGSYSEAEFNQPQGITRIGDKLYVADTENNAIRVIDLKKKTVATLVGTGRQAAQFNHPGTGTDVSLNSPWGITNVDGQLYVAMAGPHQVWKINPETKFAEPFAGSGAEGLSQGSRKDVQMAQPSGITSDGQVLYVAEPEASAVQKIGLGDHDYVKTIIGQGLFTFGDVDGRGNDVRLQHDLGIAYWKGRLLVADTYNNKIKIIDPEKKTSRTLFGSGKAGYKDGKGRRTEFDEPGGLSVLGDTLYIADTNNYLIRKANLKTDEVTTLQLTGLKKLAMHKEMDDMSPNTVITLDPISVKPGERNLTLNILLPKGYHFNEDATSRFIVKTSNASLKFDGKDQWVINTPKFPSEVKTTFVEGTNPELLVDVYAFYCEETKQALCLYRSVRYKIPVKVTPGGSDNITVSQKLMGAK